MWFVVEANGGVTLRKRGWHTYVNESFLTNHIGQHVLFFVRGKEHQFQGQKKQDHFATHKTVSVRLQVDKLLFDHVRPTEQRAGSVVLHAVIDRSDGSSAEEAVVECDGLYSNGGGWGGRLEMNQLIPFQSKQPTIQKIFFSKSGPSNCLRKDKEIETDECNQRSS